MKLLKTSLVAVSMVGALAATQTAVAVEIEASAAVASKYLFRGVDSANGNAQVSGDVTASYNGAYASVWASNAADGGEYDLIAGYGGEVGAFNYDINLTNYVYPKDDSADSIGDFSEVIVSLGYGPVGVSYADNVAGDSGYSYTSVYGGLGKVSGLVGVTDSDGDDYTHVDVSYQHNDNFALTVSKIVDHDDDTAEDDTQVVVSYSLPIK